MTELIEALGPVGFVLILKTDLFEGFREAARDCPVVGGLLTKLLACALCLGFWMGLVTSSIRLSGLDLLYGTVCGVLVFALVVSARIPKDLKSVLDNAVLGGFIGTLIAAVILPFRAEDWNVVEMYFSWSLRYAAGIAVLCLVVDLLIKMLERRSFQERRNFHDHR